MATAGSSSARHGGRGGIQSLAQPTTTAPAAERRGEQVADNSDDVVWARRHTHRVNGLIAVQRSPDFETMMWMVSIGLSSEASVPQAPDPDDRMLSKRSWESRMMGWRRAIKRFAQPPPVAAPALLSGDDALAPPPGDGARPLRPRASRQSRAGARDSVAQQPPQ